MPIQGCSNTTEHFTRYFCDLSQCTTSAGVCVDPDRRCCCRTIQESQVDLTNFGCNTAGATLSDDLRRTADVCDCTTCDDIEVIVQVTVLSAANEAPIAAAQIFNTATNNLLGLTLSDGTFQFREPLATRAVQLLIQASLFMEQTTEVQLFTSLSSIKVTVHLNPISIVAIGLGGSSVILRLGGSTVISAPPQSFSTMEGQTYNDLVFFNGMFMNAEDDLGALPNGSEQFRTNTNESFRIMQVFFLGFQDPEGDQLAAHNLRITLSVTDENDDPALLNLRLVAFIDGSWVTISNFTEVEAKRRKRQTTDPRILILTTQDVPVSTFVAVAAGINANCYLQARTFGVIVNDTLVARSGVDVILTQRSGIAGNEFLYRFGTNTGGQEPQIVNHALCLPLACDEFDTATVEASISGGAERLLPIDFDMSIFGMEEDFPIGVGHIFSILEVVTAGPNKSRPFYDSPEACIESASILQNESLPSDYFGFFSTLEEAAPPVGNCFIKVQILDCFDSNRVNVISFNVSSGIISQNIPFTVEAINETILDMYEVGKTSGDAPPPTDITFCNASCATPRIACAPFQCGEAVQVIVRPDLSVGNDQCDLTGLSLTLTSEIFSGSSDATILLVDTGIILADDFNDPILGLYFHPDSTDEARRLCELGELNNTDPVFGHAATFTCFDVNN